MTTCISILEIPEERRFKPKYGDILVGDTEENQQRYLRSITKSELLPYGGLLGPRPWQYCRDLGIDTSFVVPALLRTCPYTEHAYFGSVPILITTPEMVEVKMPRGYPFDFFTDTFTFDREALSGEMLDGTEIAHVHRAWLGSGYTEGTRTSDGSNSLMLLQHELSNGWRLHCATWIWHNK